MESQTIGRVFLVTGGNRGIGRAIVDEIAEKLSPKTIIFTCRKTDEGLALKKE